MALEMESSVVLFDDVGSARIMWVGIANTSAQNQDNFSVIICGFYCKPGGDLGTWRQIIHEFQILRKRFVSSRFVLLGDGNVHFRAMVNHQPGTEQ